MNERQAALLDLLSADDPLWPAGLAVHGPFVEPRRRRGERFKHELATAYAAWRRQEHAGELEHGVALRLMTWRRA